MQFFAIKSERNDFVSARLSTIFWIVGEMQIIAISVKRYRLFAL